MVEAVARIVPAAVAGVIVDHAVGRVNSLVGWVKPLIITTGVPAAQASQDRPLDSPTKKSACLSQRARSSKRPVAGLVLGAVRDVVPDEPGAVHRLLVDADDAIAGLLQEADDLAPAGRVVPVFALRRALHCDADIGLGDRPRVVGERDARRRFGRVDAEDVAGGAVQPDMAEIAGLVACSPCRRRTGRCCRSRNNARA